MMLNLNIYILEIKILAHSVLKNSVLDVDLVERRQVTSYEIRAFDFLNEPPHHPKWRWKDDLLIFV